LTLETKLDLCN